MTRGSLLNSPLVMQACIWAMMCIEFNRHAKCGIQNKQTTVMNACYFHFITGHHIGRKYIQVWWVLLQLWGGSSFWQGRNEDACKYLCWWNVLTAFFKNQKILIVQNANNNGELDGLHAVMNSGVETFVKQQSEPCAVEANQPPVGPCIVETDEQPVEQCAVTMLPEDIALYVNWTYLKSKERERRKRILREKMLPVPNHDGAFPWWSADVEDSLTESRRGLYGKWKRQN